MKREELRRALIAYSAQLVNEEFRMDKPRATAKHVGSGAKAKPKHVAAVFFSLLPLLDEEIIQ